MPDKNKPQTDEGSSGPPGGYRETNPIEERQGQHSFTLSMFAEIQKSLGALTSDVGTLKEQSSKHSDKIEKLGNDFHKARGAVWMLLVGGGALGFLLKLALDYATRK